MKITKSLFSKLEQLFEKLGYTIRYEKGNFRGGSCLIQEEKVIVINKFFPQESQAGTLIDILKELSIDENQLDKEQRNFLQQLRQTKLDL